MHHLRLTHPALNFHVDVRLRELDGRWLAVADLAGTPEVGGGDAPRDALLRALAPFGNVSAVLVTGGTSRIGHMPKVVSAQGPTEPTALVELARCLVVCAGGGVPR